MLYIFLADGFEEIEAVSTIDIIRRAGLEITSCSIGDKLVTGSHKITLEADTTINDCNFADAEGLILPGGMPGTLNLGKCDKLISLLKSANENQKLIAAICAAPTVLAQIGLLKGKKATVYPSYRNDIIRQGADYCENPIICGNIITANGPDTAIKFGLLIAEYFCGTEKSKAIKQAL